MISCRSISINLLSRYTKVQRSQFRPQRKIPFSKSFRSFCSDSKFAKLPAETSKNIPSFTPLNQTYNSLVGTFGVHAGLKRTINHRCSVPSHVRYAKLDTFVGPRGRVTDACCHQSATETNYRQAPKTGAAVVSRFCVCVLLWR